MAEGREAVFLSLEGVSKRYGRTHALREIRLRLARGESVVLVGPNGAGKSTLLGILAGAVRPTGGRISVGGGDETGLRARTGYLAHESLLYDGLSAMENLVFFGRLYGLERPAERAREMLDLVDLWDRRGDAVGGYSRGMKQRLAIARTLLHDPDLILLDEPFSGLDHRSARAFAGTLDLLRDGRRTVLAATHDLQSARLLGERVAVMDRGRLLHSGRVPEDLQALYSDVLRGMRP